MANVAPSSMPTTPLVDDLAAVANGRFLALESAIRSTGYRGWEFDDLLASGAVRRLTFGNLFLQRVAIQIGERSPVNLRPLLRVPKLSSTKANGFFARGYLRAYRATGDGVWLDRGLERLRLLEEARSPGVGLSWGNDFDFASRAGFFPKGTPTIVWTALIGEAFSLAHQITGERRFATAVVDAGSFVSEGLPRHEDADGVCLAYAPGIVPLVHNSNLLGATALLRAWAIDHDEHKLDLARRAFSWSLAHQRPDGGWAYGVGPKYTWIDNFHTAYVIECLMTARELTGDALVTEDALVRSVDYWYRTFFLADGTARYYADRTQPLDIQCAAQAIETLAKRSRKDEEAARLLRLVLSRAIDTFARADGLFEYRRGRFVRVPLVSLHWGQATMLSALGCVLEAEATPSS